MNKLLVTQLMVIFMSVGCSSNASNESVNINKPGSDRDSNGCIGSAGYQWCEATQQCERPWELAEQQGFENDQENFEKFCKAPSVKPLLP
jgi:hypothetical protein